MNQANDTTGESSRSELRKLLEQFALGFSKNGLHPEKLQRYVDVLAGVDLDQLRVGLESLKGEASMPAPGKIREAISVAMMKVLFERELAERNEKLRQLADPEVRAQHRADRAGASLGLVGAPDILRQFVSDAKHLGLVGESRAAKLLFLVLHTRHFDKPGQRPVSVVMKGTSSAGKSFVVKVTIQFFARGSVVEMTGMSPKWLAYASQQGMSFAHKYLFVHEASGINEEVEAMLRVLLSEGRIIWRTVIEQVAHNLEVEGPTGLIETTTRIAIHPENETRVLSIPVNEGTMQTRRVLRRIGQGWREIDLSRWHALDEWLALGPRDAVIPFQLYIGTLAKPAAPRVRRDMTTLLGLVRAHALLHEPHRAVDEQGRVIATLDDYQVVHELTRDLFAASADLSVSKSVRQVVIAVTHIIMGKQHGDGFATSAEIARMAGMARSPINRAIKAALDGEYLDELDTRRSETAPHKVKLGSRPMPDKDVSIFPTRDEIVAAMGGNGSGKPAGDQEHLDQQHLVEGHEEQPHDEFLF